MSNIIDSIQLSGVTYTLSAETSGGSYSAGTNIDITDNVISMTLPISAGTGTNSIRIGHSGNTASGNYTISEGRNAAASGAYSHAEGYGTTASGVYSHAEGYGTTASGAYSHAEGELTIASGRYSHAEGELTIASNVYERASGRLNVSSSASTTYGDSGNTLFSVGNGTYDARHNTFEIRQNGDIYIADTNDTSTSNYYDKPMIKLQDHLGGGGSPTVEVTQAEYDALVSAGTVSANTYYIITDAQAGDLTQYWTSAQTQSAITEATSGKVNISDNNVSAFSDFKVALESGKDYTSDNISTFYLGTNYTGSSTSDLVTITTTDTNYPTITIKCTISNGNITEVRTIIGITSSVENGVAQITLIGGVLAKVVSTTSGGLVFLYKQYTSGQTADVVEDTVYDALRELSNNKLDYIYKNEIINSQKTFLWGSSNDKPIIFKQSNNSAKIGFQCKNSADTNNELATFEFRPDTYTDSSSVKHPLLYIGHYRNTNTANAGVVQTMVGFRQYDQSGAAAYHYLMPLPAEAKTPFSLTTSFKNYFAPLGFKNGSTMITTDNTGVADFSDVLGGLKLVKLTQQEYDALVSGGTIDNNTLYVIT